LVDAASLTCGAAFAINEGAQPPGCVCFAQ